MSTTSICRREHDVIICDDGYESYAVKLTCDTWLNLRILGLDGSEDRLALRLAYAASVMYLTHRDESGYVEVEDCKLDICYEMFENFEYVSNWSTDDIVKIVDVELETGSSEEEYEIWKSQGPYIEHACGAGVWVRGL